VSAPKRKKRSNLTAADVRRVAKQFDTEKPMAILHRGRWHRVSAEVKRMIVDLTWGGGLVIMHPKGLEIVGVRRGPGTVVSRRTPQRAAKETKALA
jgi:hypothetical protein